MIDSKYRISLDVNSTTSNVRLKCKRGDTGRTIYAALTESGYPYHITDDCYAVFTATKPDGKKVYNGCEIEGCMIVYELTPQTVAVPGLVKCEIKLYGADDKLITSASFLLEVCNAQVNDGDELESETEVEALTQLISQAIGMNAKLEKLPNFGSGAKVGDYLMVAEVDKEKRMVTVIPTDAPADLSGYAKIEQLPKNTSDLNNDSGFVTRLVADLANYYAKSETYNRKEIDQKIGTIPKFSIKVVQSLPAQDINETTVYLLAEGNETGDLYSEWIYANGKWELLGSQRGDLTGYAKETWVDQKLTDYALVTAVPKKVSQLQNDVGYLTEHQDISGKLDANKLPEAVETALAKAKESGVFDGKDGHSPSIMVAKNEITGDVVISVEKNGVYQSVVIPKCTDGEPGEDGFSPNATVEQAENGAVITITDKNGTTTATVANGKDGTDGQDGSPGKDGSDGVSVTHEWNGTVLKVTSAAGTSSADLKGEPGKDGGKGADGQPGKDGTSPVISVSAITGGHRITITDVNGMKTVDVMDGSDGKNGADGQPGTDGNDGQPGASGVYVGEAEPTDESATIWINPDSGVAIIPTIEHNTCAIFKKVVCVGDSFTSGHIHTGESAVGTNEDYSWPSYMARLTGNEYVNCGASGATTITWLTMSRGLTKAKSTGCVQAYLVGLGLNDANGVGGITLGTAADIGTDAQTYYAGMSKIVRELNAISPKAKIFLQTMASNSPHTMACNVAIRDVVNAYADTYPVHLLDLEAYLPMYKTDLILGDKINGHYTAIGYQMFAENLRVIWSEYINNHIADFQDVYTLPYGTT